MADEKDAKRIKFLIKRIAQLEVAIRRNHDDDDRYRRDVDEQESLQRELDILQDGD